MAVVRVPVEPAVLEWAVKRSQREEYLHERFPRLDAWLSGDIQPTSRQLQDFAKKAYVAEGYLYSKTPPDEGMPIADFRTAGNVNLNEISPNLRSTIYICQRRQDWYRQYAIENGYEPLELVGSANYQTSPSFVASSIRETLGIDNTWLGKVKDWRAYRRSLITRVEDVGVLIMVSGIVKASTQRKLDPDEFRGFALHDEYAPVVFVNGADAYESQLFTIIHELAHIWIGQDGLSDPDNVPIPQHQSEAWCNAVASEFLTPSQQTQSLLPRDANLVEYVDALQKRFKVSNLAALRGLLASEVLPQMQFSEIYEKERHFALLERRRLSGGTYYPAQMMRVSRRFARAIIPSALSGATSFLDAMNLLEIKKISTMQTLYEKLRAESR